VFRFPTNNTGNGSGTPGAKHNHEHLIRAVSNNLSTVHFSCRWRTRTLTCRCPPLTGGGAAGWAGAAATARPSTSAPAPYTPRHRPRPTTALLTGTATSPSPAPRAGPWTSRDLPPHPLSMTASGRFFFCFSILAVFAPFLAAQKAFTYWRVSPFLVDIFAVSLFPLFFLPVMSRAVSHYLCLLLSLSPFISVSFYLSLVSRTFALSFSLSLSLAIFFYYVSRSYTVQYRYSLFFFSLSLRLSVSLSHQDILAFSCSLLSCFHPLTVTFSNFLDILVFLIDWYPVFFPKLQPH
jgi:hypothetical protein